MDDKDIRGILRPLIQVAETVILTKAKYERAATPEKMKEIMAAIREQAATYRPVSIHKTDTVSGAVDLAKSLYEKEDIILVAGSFYTAGEVKEALGCEGVLSGLREYN